jgi:hypothetical protein
LERGDSSAVGRGRAKTPTHYETHTNKRITKHTHITKQYKTTTVQIKTNTVQDIPK